ncbi:glucan endo-alpha-glucosidase agn1 [Colletotrichum kahawae]|uniref:Glucan endo-alpha-glucosidase agn1 n=1 Tax=Colletotrichum kahawae TaxID=34407 RepID=A0AAD9YPY3_COLKA|nr:glucan endo-alpha-glucosidase agn1 [Colletotrichum kahawae]
MRFSRAFTALAGAISLLGVSLAQQRASFAHYMLGTITAEHARKDIESAKATGFDGFALNIGDPTASFIDTSLGYLFDAADSIGGFGLYVSMDVWASGDACWHGRDSCNGPLDYHWIFQKYKGRSSYYQWNSLPVISNFDNIKWNKWKETLANEMFFIPDFDKTTGYYESHPGDLVDGLFSWESAWPERDGYGSRSPGDVSLDLSIAQGAHNHSKLYMVPLSFLQYKNSYNVSVYRAGLQALPMRMEGILDQMDQADFVQYLTWNDGPESHYIAELWPEQNSDAQPWLYMNQKMFDHTALQPLIASFNHAFKSRTESSSMTPQNGAVAVGAMWHRPMTDDAVCNPVVETIYTSRPSGSDDYYSRNMAYWSVVLKSGLPSGYKISTQAGEKEHMQVLTSGLNYGNGAGNIQAGIQTMKILDPSGKTIMSARSKRCVFSGCPQGIYNMNYLVTAFEDGTSESTCQPIGTEVMPMNAVKELEIPSCGSDKNHWLCQICNASDISIFEKASAKWEAGKTDIALKDFQTWWEKKKTAIRTSYENGTWSQGAAGRINSVFNAWLTAIDSATSQATTMKNTFLETFVYDPTKDITTQMNTWILTQVFDAVGGGIFNRLSNIIAETDKMTTITDIESMIIAIHDVQTSAVEAIRFAYFNENDVSFFASQVKSGMWIKTSVIDALDLPKTMKQVFFGNLIQQAWYSNPTSEPVIIMVDDDGSDVNPFAWKGGASGQPETLDKGDVNAARFVKDGKTFFLVRATNCQQWKVDDGTIEYTCKQDAFQGLQGITELKSSASEWGGLTKDNITTSVWAAYKLNGNANGYNISANADNSQRDSNGNKQLTMYPSGSETPGVFSIPICDYKTAYRNFAASVEKIEQ